MESNTQPLPRGRHSLSRATVEASQRARIIDAMTISVAEVGYSRTTVAQIARGAGVSLTTFYVHFADKEACFLAAYEEISASLQDAVVEAVGEWTKDWVEAIESALSAYMGHLADNPAAAATFVAEVHTAGPRALERRAEIAEQYANVITGLLRQAERDPRAPEVRPAAVRALIAAVDALVHEQVRQGRAAELLDVLPDGRYVALLILRGHQAANRLA